MRDTVSGAIAIPKASWGCAPALPNRMRVVFLRALFPVTSRRQRNTSTKCILRETDFRHPAKGGSTPAFAYQHAAIAPVALSEFATYFIKSMKLRIGQFSKMQLQQGKQIAKSSLLRKCGLLALNLASIFEKLLHRKIFSCLRLVVGNCDS